MEKDIVIHRHASNSTVLDNMLEYVQFEAHGLHPYFDLEIVSLLGSEN